MIVECHSFGSLWWLRPGSEHDDSMKFTSRAAVFNTTGFRTGARERRNWTVAGVLRFNAGTLSEQRINPETITEGKFQTKGMERSGSWNRLLFTRKVRSQLLPDAMLLNAHSGIFGTIAFRSSWRTQGVSVIASSSFDGGQESLLLMTPGSEISTRLGNWRCECNHLKMNLVPIPFRPL
jgi:hypothetical protein